MQVVMYRFILEPDSIPVSWDTAGDVRKTLNFVDLRFYSHEDFANQMENQGNNRILTFRTFDSEGQILYMCIPTNHVRLITFEEKKEI